MKSIFLILIIVVLNLSVYAQKDDAIDANTFQKNINEYEFGLIQDIEVDETGHIFVFDQFLGILLFDKQGNLVKEYNSKGQGPGDFNTIRDIITTPEGLLILDSNLYRVTLLDRKSLEYINSYNLPLLNTNLGFKLSPNRMWKVREGYIIEYKESYHKGSSRAERKRRYVLADNSFNIIDENRFETRDTEMLMVESGGEFIVSMHPFGRDELIEITEKGNIYTFWTGDTCLNQFQFKATEQQTESAICFEVLEQSDISKETFGKLKESGDIELFSSIELPDTYPFAEEMLKDQKNEKIIWLTKRSGETTTNVLKINTESSELKDVLTIDEPFKLLHVSNGRIYGTNRIDLVTGYQTPVFMSYEME